MADNALNPLTLDPAEFERFVDGISGAPKPLTTTTDSPAAQGLAPETLNALAQASQQLGALRTDVVSEEGRRMGIRPDVFLDIRQGAPASVRTRLGLDENRLNQFKLLNKIYGAGNVDLSDQGRFILRNQPAKSGGVEDVMVDPIGFEGGDVAQMGSQIIPMAVGAVAARFGLKGAERMGFGGVGKVLSGVTGMAVGQESTGAVQDAVVRAIEGNEINVSEIAKHRAAMAVVDETLGIALAGAGKGASKGVEALLGVGQIPVGTTSIQEAAKNLRQQTGVKFPLTPGQQAESEILLRMEAMAGERMGSGSALDQTLKAQRGAENELRRVFLSLPRTMSDDELKAALPQADVVGQKGLARLGSEALRLEVNVAKAGQAVERAGTAETQLASGVSFASPLNATQVGKAARDRVAGDFDAFQGAMGQRYDQFLSRPEIQARTISGNSLANAVERLEKELTPQALKQKPTGLTTPAGQPTTTPVLETLEAFVPSNVRGFVDTLKGLKGAEVAIRDLKQIRTSIDNAIKEGISIPGTDVKQLVSLKKTVEGQIESSLAGMPDKSLLPEWKALSSDYAKGMERFNRVGVREMLVKEGERGAVGNAEIAESFVGNSPRALDNYNDLKAFFGANSSEFRGMQDAARQRILIGTIDQRTGYVSGQKLRSQLDNVRPEVASELFGVNQQELHRIAEALSKAQGKLDTEELMRLGASKSLTAAKIPALVSAEQERTIAFNNKLIKGAARGQLDAEAIRPSDFVRHATEMDPNDAAKIMGILSDRPELVKEIRQLAVEEIWGRVQAGAVGKERVSAKLLQMALSPKGKPVQERTWRVILGNDTVDALESLIKTTTTREFGATAFKAAGAIGAGMEAPRLFMRGEVGAIPEIASRFLIGTLYSGPLKRSVTNLMTSNDRSRMLNAVIASTPFIESVMDRFGSDGGFLIMNALREMVEPEQERSLAVEGKLPTRFDPRTLSEEEFKRWLDNNARQ